MKLTFRKHEVKDLSQLQALVAENAEAVEPGFRVLSTTVNFGRSTVELVGVDRRKTPALIALGFTGDDTMLFRMVEAYAWTLEYPESDRKSTRLNSSHANISYAVFCLKNNNDHY